MLSGAPKVGPEKKVARFRPRGLSALSEPISRYKFAPVSLPLIFAAIHSAMSPAECEVRP